jgi:hypothetical protein
MSRIRLSKRLRVLGIGATSLIAVASSASLLAVAGAALAADLSKQASTAGQHAAMAASATDINTVSSNLHMTINCLVGPKGKAFDAKIDNPCKDLGNGALVDVKDPSSKRLLKQALAKAEAGVAQTDLAKAKADATAAENLLKKVM